MCRSYIMTEIKMDKTVKITEQVTKIRTGSNFISTLKGETKVKHTNSNT